MAREGSAGMRADRSSATPGRHHRQPFMQRRSSTICPLSSWQSWNPELKMSDELERFKRGLLKSVKPMRQAMRHGLRG
jgi:hypothetical protein